MAACEFLRKPFFVYAGYLHSPFILFWRSCATSSVGQVGITGTPATGGTGGRTPEARLSEPCGFRRLDERRCYVVKNLGTRCQSWSDDSRWPRTSVRGIEPPLLKAAARRQVVIVSQFVLTCRRSATVDWNC